MNPIYLYRIRSYSRNCGKKEVFSIDLLNNKNVSYKEVFDEMVLNNIDEEINIKEYINKLVEKFK